MVGSHLLYELTNAGRKVKALKRETSNLEQVKKTFSYYSDKPHELFNQIEWVEGDILDYFSLEKILTGVTEIYHCAAIVSFHSGEREKMIANNVEGTANLVNAAIENGIKKICHVSSIAALGRLQNGSLVTEETNWSPSKKVSGYSESKFYSEAEIWRGIAEGLEAIIVNPSIILGPANWETGSAKLFKTVWDGMPFYTRGVTGFVDVRDVVRAMIQLMQSENFQTCKNQRYLLNTENISYRELFSQIADAMEKPRPKYFTSNQLLAVVWRVSTFWGWLRRKPSMITRESVSNSNDVNKFNGQKITTAIDFQYQSISGSIEQTAAFLKKDFSKKNHN